MIYYTSLPNRRLLKLAGEDAASFLQGLVTNDISRLAEGQMLYAAMLSPQGKFLHDFFVALWKGGYWIDCDASRIENLLQRLMLYRLRSKVTIEHAANGMGVGALWGGTLPAGGAQELLLAADPRLSVMGARMIGGTEDMAGWCAAQAAQGLVESRPEAYEEWRIRHGVPDGAQDMVVDRSLIMEFGFEQLHGVDFKKGCYVGQEVTARTKFRSHLKKCLHCVQADANAMPPAGTEIRCGDMSVGEMCSSSGASGLALLRTEEFDKVIDYGLPMYAGDVVVTAHLPEWMEVIPE